jgi:hypothetical protein
MFIPASRSVCGRGRERLPTRKHPRRQCALRHAYRRQDELRVQQRNSAHDCGLMRRMPQQLAPQPLIKPNRGNGQSNRCDLRSPEHLLNVFKNSIRLICSVRQAKY